MLLSVMQRYGSRRRRTWRAGPMQRRPLQQTTVPQRRQSAGSEGVPPHTLQLRLPSDRYQPCRRRE